MYFNTNLNDIPNQFKQFSVNTLNTQGNKMEKNIDRPNVVNRNIEQEKNRQTQNKQLQNKQLQNVPDCKLTMNDRIFIFLILIIFFDIV